MTESYGACAHAQHGNVAKYSWLIAVLFCLGGAIVSNLGVNLQKLALTHKQRHTLGATSYRLMWMLGIVSTPMHCLLCRTRGTPAFPGT